MPHPSHCLLGAAALFAACSDAESASSMTSHEVPAALAATTTEETAKEKIMKTLETKYTGPKTPANVEEAEKTLQDIRKKFDCTNVPEVLGGPYSEESVTEYASAIMFLRHQREVDLEFLKNLDVDSLPNPNNANHYLVESARTSNISRLTDYLPGEIEYSCKWTRMNMKGTVDGNMSMIQTGAEADVSDRNQIVNNFGRPDRIKMRQDAIRDTMALIDVAELLDDLTGEAGGNWEAQREQVKAWKTMFDEKVEIALSSIVPPQDIGDDELRAIAEKVLADKRFKLPKHVRMVVNMGKRSHQRDTYTLHERHIEKTVRRWDEFQVATIEKDGDGYAIWYNEILYFHQGPHTVPVGKWTLGKRHKSTPILEENIEK